MRIIVMLVLSLLISRLLWYAYEAVSGNKKVERREVEFFITAENGAIGCLSKEVFLQEEKYYKSGDYQSAQRLLDEKYCFYFKKGDKLFAAEGTCSEKDKNEDLFPFKPNDFLMLQPYLPCAAVR